jgi:hypothetical protein
MINIEKKYTYRNGEPARVLCTDGPLKDYPVISLSIASVAYAHTPEGRNISDGYNDQFDLIESKPEPRAVREWDMTLDAYGNFCDPDSIDVHESLRVREIMPGEGETEAKAKAALKDGWLWYGRGPLKTDKWSCNIAIFSGDEWDETGCIGRADDLFYAIRAGSELAKLNGLEGEANPLIDALKEAKAGLNVAIGIISKELPGWDWQKSSPRIALEIVEKALAENGGADE